MDGWEDRRCWGRTRVPDPWGQMATVTAKATATGKGNGKGKGKGNGNGKYGDSSLRSE